jgi:lipid II:glycine glycyltransferase (peptidoglycan interpeptide bridge formation enzyme)
MKNLMGEEGTSFRPINNPEDWDRFVKLQDRYSFVQSSRYTWVLETICKKMNRIGVYQGEELIGLLPIGEVYAKRGKYLRLWHGPILSEKAMNKDIFKSIINYLENYAKGLGLSFVRVQPIISDSLPLIEEGFYKAPTHNLDAERTLQLLLEGRTIDEVFQSMRKNTRYYINKSNREGVRVVQDNSDFNTFFSILNETAKRQGYTTRPAEYFERLFEAFGKDGLTLYFAEVENQRVAIGLFLDYGKYRFYLEGGMKSEFTKYYPSYAIQGHSIIESISKGVEIYDFWGGVSPKDEEGNIVQNYPWAGIDLFKRGFGGDEVEMVHPHDLPIKFNYWITWIFEMIEKKQRGY